MTIETPLHVEFLSLGRQSFVFHVPMALDTTHALLNVNPVMEINEIRKIIDPFPLERRSFVVSLSHRLEYRRVFPDIGMAVHARIRTRHKGGSLRFNRDMAVPAIDSESADVMPMTERNLLVDEEIRTRHEIRLIGRAY